MARMRTANGVTVATPAAGYLAWYSKTADKRAYVLDESGNETCLMDPRPINKLINGGFDVWQRFGTDGTAGTGLTQPIDNQYFCDRWLLLANAAAIAGDDLCTQIAGGTTPQASQNALQIQQKNLTSRNLGFLQWIEAKDAIPMRGRKFTFQINNLNGGANVRLAILSWTGTADTLGAARDPVAAWANAADANPATAFFKSTTMTVDNYTAAATTNGVMSVTATINANANNVAVVVWVSTVVAQNVTYQFSEAMMMDGSITHDWAPRPYGQEFDLCRRFYRKTFPQGTKPGQNNGANTGEFNFIAGKAAATAQFGQWVFGHAMRAAPTITTFNPAAANSQVRNITGGTDCSATATQNAGDEGITLTTTGNAGGAVGDLHGVHITADAEL